MPVRTKKDANKSPEVAENLMQKGKVCYKYHHDYLFSSNTSLKVDGLTRGTNTIALTHIQTGVYLLL
jgi:hypothetical protein